MHLDDIVVRNFRNILAAQVRPVQGLNLFSGDNGQGKTNFIEALYLIINGRSFRKALRDDYVSYGETRSLLQAGFVDDLRHEIRVEIETGGRRKLYVDGKATALKSSRPMKTLFLNSDKLIYFKNFAYYRLKVVDQLCCYAYGDSYLQLRRQYGKAVHQLRLAGQGADVWERLLVRYREPLEQYRAKLFGDIRSGYEQVKERLGLPDITIKLSREKGADIQFTRRDRRDLSTGELKSVLFSLYLAALKTSNSNVILLIDDFNSEWDNTMKLKAAHLLTTMPYQSFACSSEPLRGIEGYSIAKGVLTPHGR